MVPRRLGRSGLSVSPIGLGTTKLGRNTDVKYPEAFALPSDEQARALVQTALDAGITLIDSAPAYGESETRLGQLTTSHRDRLILCTKCGEEYSEGRSRWDFSAAAIAQSLDASLRRLRTDHVDILLLHSNGKDLEILTETDALAALARAKERGKARAVGISAKTEAGILEACRSLDVVMAPFNQAETGLEPALQRAHDAGLGVLAIKGLASGYLTATAAIEFVLRRPFIDAVLVGTLRPEHLLQAVAVADRVAA